MKILKKAILILLILIIVAAIAAMPFVGDAQRMIIAMGAGLGIINLLGLLYFLRKNEDGRPPRP